MDSKSKGRGGLQYFLNPSYSDRVRDRFHFGWDICLVRYLIGTDRRERVRQYQGLGGDPEVFHHCRLVGWTQIASLSAPYFLTYGYITEVISTYDHLRKWGFLNGLAPPGMVLTRGLLINVMIVTFASSNHKGFFLVLDFAFYWILRVFFFSFRTLTYHLQTTYKPLKNTD